LIKAALRMDLKFDSEGDMFDVWPEREEDMVLVRVSPLTTGYAELSGEHEA